jgi:hypothetical protein
MRPKKHLVVFLVMALLGTNLEIASRAGELVGYGDMQLKPESLAGWTSLWMLPVYGAAGLALGQLNESDTIRGLPMLLQSVLALTVAWTIELCTGSLLNLKWGLHLWDYADQPYHFKGQIGLYTGVQFFLIAPLVFWADDLVRYLAYREDRPDTLASYYRALFIFRPTPPRKPVARAEKVNQKAL